MSSLEGHDVDYSTYPVFFSKNFHRLGWGTGEAVSYIQQGTVGNFISVQYTFFVNLLWAWHCAQCVTISENSWQSPFEKPGDGPVRCVGARCVLQPSSCGTMVGFQECANACDFLGELHPGLWSGACFTFTMQSLYHFISIRVSLKSWSNGPSPQRVGQEGQQQWWMELSEMLTSRFNGLPQCFFLSCIHPSVYGCVHSFIC